MIRNPEIVQLSRWAAAGERISLPDLESFVYEASRPRQQTLLDFHALGLPGYRNQVIIPSSDFALNPNTAFESIPTEKCWFQVLPTDNDETVKLTVVDNGKTHDEARDLIARHLDQTNAHDRSVVFLSEFLENIYGGSVVANTAGELYVEFGEGTQINFSAGEAVPTHFAEKKTGRVMKYSFDDIRLRSAIWRTVSAIPHSDGEFFPGYYEFTLAGKNLRPIFLDYRMSAVFQIERIGISAISSELND